MSRRGGAGLWTDEDGGTLFHGTSSPPRALGGRSRVRPGLTYLAPSYAEAGIFASNPFLSGQRGGAPRVHEVRAAPGRTKDVNARAEDAVMGDEDVGEVIETLGNTARADGYRYLSFEHPGLGDDYMTVRVSLYPHEDLLIVATRLVGDGRWDGPPGEPTDKEG